jgi:hypothetical protein
MDKNKITEKLKEINTEELQNFYQKNTLEVLSALSLVIGAISSSWDFFTGPKLTIIVFALGAVVAIFFTKQVRKMLNQLYSQIVKSGSKTTVLIAGAVSIVLGIFIPFVLFGVFGLLAGTAFHYFTHEAGFTSSGKRSMGED